MEYVKLIEAPFTTADAEYPVVIADGGTLTVKYMDWRENDVEIHFGEPVAYKWQMCEEYLEGERFDSCYEVVNSKWLQKHIEQELICENEGHCHFKFNFNENGQLEVIALGFEVKT